MTDETRDLQTTARAEFLAPAVQAPPGNLEQTRDLLAGGAALPQQASGHAFDLVQRIAALTQANRTLERKCAEHAAREAELRSQNAVLENRLAERSVAALQQAHEAARTKEFAAGLLLNSIDGVLAFDRECRVTLWNPAMERIGGMASADVLGQNVFDRFPFLLETGEDRSFRDTLAGHSVERVDRPYRLPAGREGYYEAHYAPLRDESNEIVGGLVIVRDITQRKRDERLMLQTERLAAVAEMVTGLAHESRNALQRSQACLDVLSLKIRDRPEVADLIARIQRAQDRLHTLYEEVRTYAAPITLNAERCDLGQLLEQACDDLRSAQPAAEITLSQHGSNMNLNCRVDPQSLRQVFRKVLENSVAASREPVKVDVGWSDQAWQDKPALQVTVEDDGPGLTSEQLSKMFNPFYTTKTQGTGLGLAVAKRIVEAHGGSISAEAGAGRGARIRIILPRNIL